ncbi:MAG: sigma-70 family RNA polymerase sigma factor [Planctomycetes bacterium]|nr:sigma-70 family RNA polymerase sigma factor [Planctomycetota bacterium]MCC7173043.1 sigma-70 family RNA polymerase sigma factor [Planctomycetota bacterium]
MTRTDRMTTDEDAPLVARARAGDRAAFDALVIRHARCVARLARRVVGNAEDAEDVVQETFVRVFQHLQNFRGRSSFRTWSMHIALNLAHDRLRTRRRTPSPRDLAAGIAPLDSLAPDHAANGRDDRAALERAVADLPPRQRLTLLMKVVDGLTHVDIAKVLGTTESAARVYLSMARSTLRRRLASWFARDRRNT